MINVNYMDLIVILLYITALASITIISTRKSKGSSNFNVGGKSFGQLATAASQGASMKGSNSLIVYGGGAWTSGIGVLFSSQCYNIGGWVTVIIGLARRLKKCSDVLDIQSLGDIFYYRFGKKRGKITGGIMCTWLGLITAVTNTIAIGLLLYMAFGRYGLAYDVAVYIGGIIVLLCTVFGGLTSVVYTDTFQWFIMTPMIFIIIPLFCILKGGATPEHVHSVLDASFFSLKPSISWFGYLISGLLTSIVDITLLMRFIAAKDERTAVRGSSFGFLYTTLWAGIVIMFGLTGALVVTPDMVTGSDQMLYALVGLILPNGILGLFCAALIATTVTTANSNLHIAVVGVTHDIVASFTDKKLSVQEERKISRIVSVVLTIVGVLIATQFDSILPFLSINYAIYASIVFVPTIATLYWRKATETSVFVSMISGAVVFCIVNYGMHLNLPVIYGVSASLIGLVVCAMLQNKPSNLLPGFDGEDNLQIGALKKDSWIGLGGLIGLTGSLTISIGIGLWINWPVLIVGVVILFAGLFLIDKGVPKNAAAIPIQAE